MSQSPDDEQAERTDRWLQARSELSRMIKQGRSFSGHERNCFFLNTGGDRFATASAVSGLDFADDARAVAIVDWDQDGDLDLWISNRNAPRLRLMRNDTPTGKHHVSLRLVGDGKSTNRDAVGARVEVVLSPPAANRLIKTLRAGEGFLAQSTKWIHFGLDRAQRIEKVTVHWPGAQVQDFVGLAVDGRYLLRQDSSQAKPWKGRERQLALKPSTPELPPPSRVARIPLIARWPMPILTYTQLDGATRTLAFDTGKPVLLNLWASWCRPCINELKQLASRESDIRTAGIEVVALAIDGLGDNPSDSTDAATLITQLKFPFSAGRANLQLLADLQKVHDDLVLMRRPLPIPTTFLIDANGRLAVLYKGPLSVDDVLRDAAVVPGSYVARFQRAACLPGRALLEERVAQSSLQADTRTRYRVASALQRDGRLKEAAVGFLDLLDSDPECAEAHGQLARILLQQGKFEQAARHCQRALDVDPDDARMLNTLGNVLASQQQPEQAKSHYQRAIDIEPEFAEAHNNLGSLLAGREEFELAAARFNRALVLEPDFAEAHCNLGSVYATLGDLSQASRYYENAIRIDPDYCEAHNNLGSVHARRGNLAQAVKYYRRALEIDPNYEEARRNLRQAQSRMGTKTGGE